MNRTLTSGGITLAMIGIFSCTEHSLTGVDNFTSDDLSADASRIATVSVSLGSGLLALGDTTRAIVTLKDYRGQILNRDVNWRSSDSAVASVDSAGLVRGIAVGTAVITAWRGFKSGSATITVTPPVTPGPTMVAAVSVSLAVSSLNPGQFTQATATVYDSSNNVLTGRAVAWSSSDTSIATISSAGVVTAVAVGTSQIVATSEGKTGAASLAVTSPPQQTTNPGTVTDLKVIAADSTGITVSFTQVNDGTGHPASYDVRYATPPIAWGSATSTTAGSCTVPITGTAIGSPLVCKVLALTPSTKYDLQLIAFRGTLNFDAVFGSLSNVASATTTALAPPPPVPVASVTVSPAAPSVQVGGTVQFSAVTRDANNNVLTGRSITWGSNNTAVATVSGSALGTGVAVGSTQITATSEGKIGSATLTVTSPPPPPPPGTDTLWRRNEPTGMTLIDERSFNSLTETDSPHVPFWFWAGGSIVTDPSAPHSAPSVLRATYPTGFIGGSAALQAGVEGQGISNHTFYISWWAKYSANWFGHLTGVNKQCYFAANGSAGQAFFEANGVGTNPLRPAMVLQSGYGTDGTFYPNLVPNATVPRDKWFYVEVVLVGNTAGKADGSFDWYIDGVHVGNKTGLLITTTATGWDRFNFDPIWGGAGDVIPATQTLDLDHVYLSGKK